jgi:glycerol uptake facilitator-like aquaporin
VLGEMLANLIFGLPAINLSTHTRSRTGIWLGEMVATFGLLLVGLRAGPQQEHSVCTVCRRCYITGAYFFTSSTSFANPAVTLARTLSDTFAGLAPSSVPAFVLAQVLRALIACGAIRVLWPEAESVAADVVVPHEAVDGQRAARSR